MSCRILSIKIPEIPEVRFDDGVNFVVSTPSRAIQFSDRPVETRLGILIRVTEGMGIGSPDDPKNPRSLRELAISE